MKKSSLTTAVLAGLVGVAGFAGSASAVSLNPDGVGQVLIYPYYTVNQNQNTIISVVNTDDVGKAVKVRFLEAYNSREVLDFNLFMSPYDVWTATVFDLGEVVDGAVAGAMGTSDTTCTVPRFYQSSNPAVHKAGDLWYTAFRDYRYTGANNFGAPSGLARTREGYVEMIQMADIAAGSKTLAAVTHSNGVPANCGSPLIRNTANPDFVAPTGGLFGNGIIVDVSTGTMYAYAADALSGFSERVIMTAPGSTDPNLAFANYSPGAPGTYRADVTISGVHYALDYVKPIDSVSAVFQAEAVLNEWVVNPALDAGTDWVVTLPTKAFYVDPFRNTAAPAGMEPFSKKFAKGTSCFVVGFNTWNREEHQSFTPDEDEFSPHPPKAPPSSLCTEVNIITFNQSNILGSSDNLTYNVDVSKVGDAGWMRLDLDTSAEPHAMVPAANGTVLRGLPVTGFAAERYINNNAQPGMLANYSGAFRHRVERATS